MDKFPITQPKSFEFKYITEEFFYNRSVPFDRATVKVLLDTGYHSANPQTRQLVKELRQEAGNDDARFAQLILEYFRKNGFTYSLKPLQINLSSPP